MEILTIMSSFKETWLVLSGCVSQTYFSQIEASQFFKKYETEKADFLAVNIEKGKKLALV